MLFSNHCKNQSIFLIEQGNLETVNYKQTKNSNIFANIIFVSQNCYYVVQTDQHLSEQTMAALIEQGDLKAFTILYNKYAAALLGIIKRITGEQTVAENILQQTFIELWNNKQAYSSSKEKVFTWMFKTARRLAIENIRGENDLNTCINNLVYSKEVEDHITGRNKSICIEEEIVQALRLIYFKAYTTEDAAHELNITINDLQSKLKPAIEHLNAVIA